MIDDIKVNLSKLWYNKLIYKAKSECLCDTNT